MNEIADGLWVSDIDSAREDDTSRFDRVVTVCQDMVRDNISERQAYEHYPLCDGPEPEERWGGSVSDSSLTRDQNGVKGVASYELFLLAANSVYYAWRHRGETVLVHCHHGQSRSVAVVAAVVGRWRGYDAFEALDVVSASRPQADPGHVMFDYLERYLDQYNPSLSENNVWAEIAAEDDVL